MGRGRGKGRNSQARQRKREEQAVGGSSGAQRRGEKSWLARRRGRQGWGSDTPQRPLPPPLASSAPASPAALAPTLSAAAVACWCPEVRGRVGGREAERGRQQGSRIKRVRLRRRRAGSLAHCSVHDRPWTCLCTGMSTACAQGVCACAQGAYVCVCVQRVCAGKALEQQAEGP